jgi:two-component system NtrC family sensor kinase
MKKLYLPIFWKLFIAIVITVAVFAFLNIIFVWNKVFQTMESEISKRGINIAKNLANQSIYYLLYKDLSTLQILVENSKNSDPMIVYSFIVDNSDKVLAHTFDDGFPKDLLNANQIMGNDSLSIIGIHATNFISKNIKDINVPILNGKLGYVRMGLNYDSVWLDLKDSLITFIFIFIIFTILGISGAFLFAKLISHPIKKVKLATESLDMTNIDSKNIIPISQKINKLKTPLKIQVNDEIDDLIEKFDEMILRLEKTYQKLISTQHAMNQSEKLASIGTLVAGIAHEINNPLSGLQSCLRRMSEKPDNISQNLKYLALMNDSTSKIQSVVNGLLDFTRVSNSNKTKQDISVLLDNSIKLIQYRKSFKEVTIIKKYEREQYFTLCNKNQIEQVFFNLLKNSIDAIEEKYKVNENYEGRIIISVNKSDLHITVEIKDNGIGIQKKDILKVFDPFYTTKDVGKGTGLGCSISYSIIKEHNGEMEIESEYLEWTKVNLKFIKYSNE